MTFSSTGLCSLNILALSNIKSKLCLCCPVGFSIHFSLLQANITQVYSYNFNRTLLFNPVILYRVTIQFGNVKFVM